MKYNYYIKIGNFYVSFVGSRQDPVMVSSVEKATPFTTESLANAKAKYKGLKQIKIVKART